MEMEEVLKQISEEEGGKTSLRRYLSTTKQEIKLGEKEKTFSSFYLELSSALKILKSHSPNSENCRFFSLARWSMQTKQDERENSSARPRTLKSLLTSFTT
mmetsp:Transcript_17097/g.19212  ORF Transcript_17097/g.19212 Transcript_17097/m.19212 type:complete len:101 (+) Transcript_17097:218-520(+)